MRSRHTPPSEKMSKRAGKPLDFPGGLTQLQWCSATLQNLEREVHKSRNCLSRENPSVANVVDGLLSGSRETVQAVCLVLTEATSRGLLSGDDVITILTSSCPSMPQWTLSVYALAKLLMKKVLVLLQAGSLTTCPYSLRSSPLPFISIFNSKPESGLVISDVAVQMLKESTNFFRGVLVLLTPLLKYMFLHPMPSSEHSLVSSHLHSSLLTLAEALAAGNNEHESKLILKLLTKLIPLSPSSTIQSILTLSNNVQRLAELWSMIGEKEEEVVVMVDVCLALCCKCLETSLSFDSLLATLSKLITASPPKAQLFGHQILCLSWLMFNSLLLPPTLDLILHLMEEMLKLCPHVSAHLPMMILPLVQVLSLPPSQSSHQESAHTLTLAIQENKNWTLEDLDTVKSSRCLLPFQPYPVIKSFYKSLRSILSTPTSMETWLNIIAGESELSTMPSSSLKLLTLSLSTLLTRSVLSQQCDSSAEFSLTLKALSAVAKTQPSLSPSLLPLILYLFPLASSPSLKLTLLQSLPSLVTHKYAVTPTANVLRTLAGNPCLLPVSLRVLGELWSQHDSAFPLIVSLLVQQKVPPAVSAELDIAKAIVIKDICCTRGEQHGEEMLSHISLIFKQSRVPLAIALVTEALAALCQCDVADPVTVWSVFGESLLNTHSVPVVVASCSIMSMAASVGTEERQAAQLFKDTALKSLWSMVFSQNHKVVSAALNGLRNLSITDFLLEHLPPEAPTVQHGRGDSFPVDAQTPEVTQLPANYCVHLVAAVPPESLSSLSLFLSALLPSEVEAVPRGAISSVMRRQSQIQSPLERAVRGAENLLMGMCLVNSGRDSTHGMVASTTLLLHAITSSTDQTEPRSRGGHVALKDMIKYAALLEEALANGHISLNLHDGEGDSGDGRVLGAMSCLILPRRWALFMKKVCDIFTKVWLTSNCPASILDNSSALEEKFLKVRDWAKKELVAKLSDTLRSSPSSSSNVLLALIGLVCVTDPLPPGSSKIETTSEPATEWSSMKLLSSSITHIQCFITGSEVESGVESAALTLLSDLKICVDISVFLLVCPLLVETALTSTHLSTTFRALEDFVLCLWSHFNASPTWYGGIVINEILLPMLPRMSQGESIDDELIHFGEASQKSQSFEYQSVVSALVPTLVIMRHANLSLGVTDTLKALLATLSSDQLEMEQPQIVCVNYVNSCRLLYLNGIISDQDADDCVTCVADLATKAPHVAVYHFCLGSLMYGLMAGGHPTAQDLADTIAVRWFQQLSDHLPSNELLVTIWGLAGLIGVNPVHEKTWYKEEIPPLTFIDSLFPLLRDILGKHANEDSSMVRCHTTWILGCIYTSLTALFSTIERAPKDYSYLPEGTLLPTLLSYLSDRRTDVRQVKCLLSALLSVSSPLPPCDMSSVLFPFLKLSKLQVLCVKLVIQQSSLVGMKLLTRHIFNLMLAGQLTTEAERLLLENWSRCAPLIHAWNHFQPLSISLLKHYPRSQKRLHGFLSGMKDSITSGATTTESLGCSEIMKQIWDRICEHGSTVEIASDTQGKLLLRLVAECLAATGYAPASFDIPSCALLLAQASLPVMRTAFECILLGYWVESGKCGVSTLAQIIHWSLTHSGLLENGIHTVLMGSLVEVVRHVSSFGTSQKSLVVQTELLHSLLVWTRTTEPSSSQMHWVLFLCVVVASPSPPNLVKPLSLDIEHWLASFSAPSAPILQEKILQCLVEWFAVSDTHVHQVCLSLLSRLTSTGAYGNPVLWTTVAHLL